MIVMVTKSKAEILIFNVSLTRSYRIPLSVGTFYKSEVICDIVEMDAYRMVLDGLWQFDVDIVYKDSKNTYKWKDEKVTVTPTMRAQKASKVEGKAFLTVTNSASEFTFDKPLYPDDDSESSCFKVEENDVELLKEKILN